MKQFNENWDGITRKKLSEAAMPEKKVGGLLIRGGLVLTGDGVDILTRFIDHESALASVPFFLEWAKKYGFKFNKQEEFWGRVEKIHYTNAMLQVALKDIQDKTYKSLYDPNRKPKISSR
jgi:hypothetical protein